MGATVLRRLLAISVLPFVGALLFAAAGALGLPAFAHNSAIDCVGGFSTAVSASCATYLYRSPVALGIVGVLLAGGGGAFASYYAARHVGLPAMAVFRQRRRS